MKDIVGTILGLLLFAFLFISALSAPFYYFYEAMNRHLKVNALYAIFPIISLFLIHSLWLEYAHDIALLFIILSFVLGYFTWRKEFIKHFEEKETK